MKKNIVKYVLAVAVVAVAGMGVYESQNEGIELSGVSLANVEALASGEGDYSQKIWERFYRPDCTGYNCTKTGNETC